MVYIHICNRYIILIDYFSRILDLITQHPDIIRNKFFHIDKCVKITIIATLTTKWDMNIKTDWL